jgi:inner membrane protein
MTRGEEYALRRAQVASLPALRSVLACPAFSLSRPSSLPLSPIGDEGSSFDRGRDGRGALAWVDEFVMPLARIRSLPEASCEGDAFLRFARAPFVLEEGIPRAPGPLMGDLRYDNEAGRGFAEVPLTLDPSRCPRWIPQWVPPRADVLYSGG